MLGRVRQVGAIETLLDWVLGLRGELGVCRTADEVVCLA